ncbi:hypothetical protein CBR_g39138 [Chara braunii]|uniref:Citrate transporter-like domain-containing protein n=1 Tax=Chara braunii TaxID=69332 RepID=A0A388LR67_CHABU|nr:hypothetical protein CBR_g39138 [Chara braunii]|eukprot:GBG84761.1 hypothetical protein CBR_g39138 [Chara braunii]
MAVVFALGYAGIAFEGVLGFNKSALVLLMTVVLWTIRSITVPGIIAVDELNEQTSSASEIILFLLGAMTIVEVVDAHRCFNIVQAVISTKDMRVVLWMTGLFAFCLSAVLDDLTTTITLISLLRKLVPNPEQRKYCGAAVVLAANAGGAWTPIGDVTTSMLWINGQISAMKIMQVCSYVKEEAYVCVQ